MLFTGNYQIFWRMWETLKISDSSKGSEFFKRSLLLHHLFLKSSQLLKNLLCMWVLQYVFLHPLNFRIITCYNFGIIVFVCVLYSKSKTSSSYIIVLEIDTRHIFKLNVFIIKQYLVCNHHLLEYVILCSSSLEDIF